MNKKEQQLQDNNTKVNNFKKSKNLLIKGLNKHEKIDKLKPKENDELRNEIKKLKKLNKQFTDIPIMLQDVKKRDDKAKTFAPPHKRETNKLNEQVTDIPIILQDVRKRDDKARTFAPPHKKETKKFISDFEELQEFKDKLLKDENKYVDINLTNINDLIDEMKKNLEKRNNILDIGSNKSLNLNDILNFLQNIIDGKINDFNKEEKYNEKFKDVEKKLENRTKNNNNIILYDYYLNYLKKILFSIKKSSDKGLTISALPILLSKIYTNN